MKRYEVELAGVTVKAGDVGEALEVAADLLEGGADADVLITCDGEVDEALTELAREGLRPVDLSDHGRSSHLGARRGRLARYGAASEGESVSCHTDRRISRR